MDPSNFPSQISPPQMYNFMQLPSTPLPWANAMQRVQGQLPKSSEQMKKIFKHKLDAFWRHQKIEMYQRKSGAVYKQHALPLARIKRIMKMDDEVKMISGDTPVLLAKACELFILELTLRSFVHTEYQMRLTIRRCDIADAIYNADEFDFLTGIVPPDAKDEFAPDFDLEANLVSLRSILEPQQFIIPDQDPEADGNYIISGPPTPL